MGHSFDHRCNGKAALLSMCIVEVHVVFNNVIMSVAQFFFHKFMLPAIIKYAQSSCKIPHILVGF